MRLFLLGLIFIAQLSLAKSLKDLNGEDININTKGWTHLIFFDNWESYAGNGPEAFIPTLSQDFQKNMQRIWIRPRMNVTNAQMVEYQQAFPIAKTVVIDEHFALMRRYQLWQLPYHIVLHDGVVKFKGERDALAEFVNQNTF